MYTHVHSSKRFYVAKGWKQPEYPSTDEWINKMQSIHTIEYYSALKRNEILKHVTTWMNLEISQTQINKYCMIPYFIFI